jgi:hypothetical protein
MVGSLAWFKLNSYIKMYLLYNQKEIDTYHPGASNLSSAKG